MSRIDGDLFDDGEKARSVSDNFCAFCNTSASGRSFRDSTDRR